MTWPRDLPRDRVDHLVVVFSDIEMGAGGPLDDFPQSDFLGEFLLTYNQGPFADIPVDVVFNGDTFDFLKTSYRDGYPRHITTEVALGKAVRVAAAHPGFFGALRRFVAHEAAPRRAHFIVGNHDPELVFPEVQEVLRAMAGGSDRIQFPGFSFELGRLRVEHGNQLDPLFALDPEAPFVNGANGDKMLNLPWASVALLDVAIPLHPVLHFHDRVIPKGRVLELLPEIKEVLLERYWQYWTRDYWKGSRSDPVKKVTWSMLKEIFGRYFFSHDTEVSPVGEAYLQWLNGHEDTDVVVIGHTHRPSLWSYGRRKLFVLGCFRNEYQLLDDEGSFAPLPKTYCEVFLSEGRPVRSHLVEIEGPPLPAGFEPDDLLGVREKLQALLSPAAVREREKQARKAQEAQEQEAQADAPALEAPALEAQGVSAEQPAAED
ncbi:MAG: hypothetical protein AB7N76_18240 [Planctomycetota bacterium]